MEELEHRQRLEQSVELMKSVKEKFGFNPYTIRDELRRELTALEQQIEDGGILNTNQEEYTVGKLKERVSTILSVHEEQGLEGLGLTGIEFDYNVDKLRGMKHALVSMYEEAVAKKEGR